MVRQVCQIVIAGACVLGVANLCLAQAGGIYDAPKRSISIDGDLSDWSGAGFGVLSHSHDHGEPVNGGSNVPLQVDIRFAWDDEHLYTLVQETVADDDPDEGANATSWTSESGGTPSPWNTDSIGFYEGSGNTALNSGPQSQWWVGLSSSTDADQIRHQARPPDALYIGDAANNITDGLRAVEFRMLWDDIRYGAGDAGAITNHLDSDNRDSPSHTREDVGAGYIFRNDPLLVDGAIGAGHKGQAFPGGSGSAEGVAALDRSFVMLIPEPSSLIVLGSLCVLGLSRRRRRH